MERLSDFVAFLNDCALLFFERALGGGGAFVSRGHSLFLSRRSRALGRCVAKARIEASPSWCGSEISRGFDERCRSLHRCHRLFGLKLSGLGSRGNFAHVSLILGVGRLVWLLATQIEPGGVLLGITLGRSRTDVDLTNIDGGCLVHRVLGRLILSGLWDSLGDECLLCHAPLLNGLAGAVDLVCFALDFSLAMGRSLVHDLSLGNDIHVAGKDLCVDVLLLSDESTHFLGLFLGFHVASNLRLYSTVGLSWAFAAHFVGGGAQLDIVD